MAFRIRSSYLVAFAIAAGIGGWMYNGEVVVGGQVDPATEAAPIAEREAERSSELFSVRYQVLQPSQREKSITVRGRTRAEAIIPIKSETSGVVEKRLVDKGDFVKQGDLVCVLEGGARGAQLTQAQAQLEQAEAEYISNKRLSEKGVISRNRLATFKAARDAALAAVAQANQEMKRVEIRAIASGTVQAPIAEVGDALVPGSACVTLVDSDPMFFIGQISERDIAKVEPKMRAEVQLFSGDKIGGTVTYIAPSADPATRTFLVEVRLDKSEANILDGLTANGTIVLEPEEAFLVNSSWLGLSDSGEVGLRYVDENDTVGFQKVEIKGTADNGFWVTGPVPGMRVISLGQEFVGAGEKVIPVADDRESPADKTALLKSGETK